MSRGSDPGRTCSQGMPASQGGAYSGGACSMGVPCPRGSGPGVGVPAPGGSGPGGPGEDPLGWPVLWAVHILLECILV